MAGKFSKSILGNLKKILHRAPEKPSGPAPRKTSASKEGARKHVSSPPSVEPAPDKPEAPEAKTDKKKPKNQPWYRHRQRW
ncbi:MAG: hypothetical protein E6H45_08655 [Betaproteobacteria bacterium]|nr:MAG: hypothetical protein E6H45_08655 [Betaproteobacteria bacterium]